MQPFLECWNLWVKFAHTHTQTLMLSCRIRYDDHPSANRWLPCAPYAHLTVGWFANNVRYFFSMPLAESTNAISRYSGDITGTKTAGCSPEFRIWRNQQFFIFDSVLAAMSKFQWIFSPLTLDQAGEIGRGDRKIGRNTKTRRSNRLLCRPCPCWTCWAFAKDRKHRNGRSPVTLLRPPCVRPLQAPRIPRCHGCPA